MSFAMRQQVQKRTDKMVEAINRKGHKVHVLPETMKKHPGEYKPAPKDKDHDAHKSEHHSSAPQIVKDNFHAKPASDAHAKEWRKDAAEGVKTKECQEMVGQLTKNIPDRKKWADLSEEHQDEITWNVAGNMAKGAVVGGTLAQMGYSWAAYAVVGATAPAVVSVTPAVLAVGAVVGALAWLKSNVNEFKETGDVRAASEADLKKKIENAIANPTMKDLENAAHVTDGKGGVSMAKVDQLLGVKKREGKKASLRSKTIRLAHENPELRKHLLPLLQEKS